MKSLQSLCDSLATDKSYLEFISDQFKNIVTDIIESNNLYEQDVVFYGKPIKNVDLEQFFYGRVALGSEKYICIKIL